MAVSDGGLIELIEWSYRERVGTMRPATQKMSTVTTETLGGVITSYAGKSNMSTRMEVPRRFLTIVVPT